MTLVGNTLGTHMTLVGNTLGTHMTLVGNTLGTHNTCRKYTWYTQLMHRSVLL